MQQPDPGSFDEYAGRVLDLVDEIPPGYVMTYGDIASCIGSGPRRVARVMSMRGDEVPWWRVLRADGTPAPQVFRRQIEHLRAEGAPLAHDGARVLLKACRWTGALRNEEHE